MIVILVIEIKNFCCNLRQVQLAQLKAFYHFQIWRCLVIVDESTSAAYLHVHEMTPGRLRICWMELVLGLLVLSSLLLEMDDGEEVVGV